MSSLSAAGRTDRGRARPHNEDALLVAPELGVIAVADGMGGHAAGEVASRLAIEAITEVFEKPAKESEDVPSRLRRAVAESNRRIAEHIRQRPETSGMGTTLVVLAAEGERFWVAHVGDSRAYLVRGGQIAQLTTDHSFVNELVRLGMLSREQAARDPRRNVVTRALGSGGPAEPDVSEGRFLPEDVVLLCTDGLNTMLADEDILRVVEQTRHDLDRSSEALVDAANQAGGEDNVTVVLGHFRPTPAEEPLPSRGEDERDTAPHPASSSSPPSEEKG